MIFGVKREMDTLNRPTKNLMESPVGAPLGRMGSGLIQEYGSPKQQDIYPSGYDPMEAPIHGQRNLDDDYNEQGVYEYDEAPQIDITTLNQLEPKDRVIAESLVHVLGGDLILMLYNRNWNTRQTAYQELNKGLKKFNPAKMDRDQL